MQDAKRLIARCEAPAPTIRRSCIQPSTLSHAMKAPVSIQKRRTWRLRRRFAYSVASSTLETTDPANRVAPQVACELLEKKGVPPADSLYRSKPVFHGPAHSCCHRALFPNDKTGGVPWPWPR